MPAAASIPNSSASQRPRLRVQAGACDAHIHIIDPGFAPAVAGTPAVAGMSVDDYRQLQRSNGTTRVVIVQPKYYGTDNRCTLDAVARFDGQARGIAVVHPSISEAELERLAAGGIRGLRFSLWNPKDTVTTPEMILPLAERIAALGWHIQLHLSGDQIVQHQALLDKVKVPMVFDHMGRLPPAQGTAHPAFAMIGRWLDADRAWVKLSGAYLNTAEGGPGYADASRVARAFVKAAPERLVWGSDWPHITEQRHKPDDSLLLDLISGWASTAETQRILIENPQALYGFH
ncbi:amidohydrolase family protein [Pseudomonas sp. S31]|uniref:amidohydrolase family protein n=1 Tax=Pseudomonas sp. S31 TaxID=1564473 RepID=UPI002E2B01CA|nr:amidohydrolase family protein [Pseudomonas sp. S31]